MIDGWPCIQSLHAQCVSGTLKIRWVNLPPTSQALWLGPIALLRTCTSRWRCSNDILCSPISGSSCRWGKNCQSSTLAYAEQYLFQDFLLGVLSCKLIQEHFSVPEKFLWELWKDRGCLFLLYSAQFCHWGSNRKLPVYWEGVTPCVFCENSNYIMYCQVPLSRMNCTIVTTALVLSNGPNCTCLPLHRELIMKVWYDKFVAKFILSVFRPLLFVILLHILICLISPITTCFNSMWLFLHWRQQTIATTTELIILIKNSALPVGSIYSNKKVGG